MLPRIFKEVKNIIDAGGMALILDFGMECNDEVLAIPIIQLIIGDYKGNMLLYGRK